MIILQLQTHINQFLISGDPGIEAPGIPSEFCKTQAPVKGHGPFVIRNHVQLQLFVACLCGASDAGLHHRSSEAEPPVFLKYTDPRFRPVTNLVFAADGIDAGRPRQLSVNNGNDLDFVIAFGFCVQEACFLFGGKAVFIWIRKQIIRLGMGLIENLVYGSPVGGISVPEYCLRAVL